jgi:hypothetical protein
MRTVGSLLSALTYLDCDALEGDRLHALLGDALARCASISHLLQQQYALQ